MTLVRLKRHGQILMEMMKSPALELTSSMGNLTRRQGKQAEQFSVWRNRCFNRLDYSGVGVDVPSVGAVILAGGGKAELK